MAQLNTDSMASFASDISTTSTSRMFMDVVAQFPVPKVEVAVDARVPKTMALIVEGGMVRKCKELDFFSTMLLALHAGIFVSMGAGFFTVVHAGTPTHFGLQKFLGGLAFCTGLAMVILCGSELFTGNSLISMAWLTKKVSTLQLLRNWFLVYTGNFMGSLIIAALQVWGRTHENASGSVGWTALDFCNAKCGRDWGACYGLGILCNIVVCWSVWMTIAGRTAMDKLLVFMLPITAFAAMGFEHCVANMYFLPVALMIRTYGSDKYRATQLAWAKSVGKVANASATWDNLDPWPECMVGKCIYNNIIPATIGNVSGAIAFVGMIYWYLYLRDDDHVSRVQIGSWLASPPVRSIKKAKPVKTKDVGVVQATPLPMPPMIPDPISRTYTTGPANTVPLVDLGGQPYPPTSAPTPTPSPQPPIIAA